MTVLARQPRESASDDVDCPEFESTILLMDGELTGASRAEALDHVRQCPVCDPLVRGWPAVAGLLDARFAEAAELAKPDLAGLASRVVVESEARTAAQNRLTSAVQSRRVRLRSQLVGAMAAAAMTLVPSVSHGPMPAPVTAMPARPIEVAVLPPAAPPVDANPNDLHMHKLEFDGADGMVYRTESDGMTVIWVTEHDGV